MSRRSRPSRRRLKAWFRLGRPIPHFLAVESGVGPWLADQDPHWDCHRAVWVRA